MIGPLLTLTCGSIDPRLGTARDLRVSASSCQFQPIQPIDPDSQRKTGRDLDHVAIIDPLSERVSSPGVHLDSDKGQKR